MVHCTGVQLLALRRQFQLSRSRDVAQGSIDVDDLGDVAHVDHGADGVGDDRQFTGVGEHTLIHAATELRVVVGQIGAKIPVVAGVEEAFRITFPEGDDDDLVAHRVVGTADALQDSAVGQNAGVLDRRSIRRAVALGFDVVVDVRDVEDVFEDDAGGDHLVGRLLTIVELALVVAVLMQQREHVE